MIIFIVLSLTYNVITSKNLFSIFGKREILYLTLSLAIGPGLIVNFWLKDHSFGRARPINIQEFAGKKDFSPIFTPTNNCTKNCAFSSGHAAFAFFLTAFAFIIKSHQRLIWRCADIYGVLVSIGRVMQGGHFLSDVLFSAIIVMFVNMILYKLIFYKI